MWCVCVYMYTHIFAGLLNPLDCPHHMRASDDSRFREGVVLNKPVKEGRGSFADVGLIKKVTFIYLLKMN